MFEPKYSDVLIVIPARLNSTRLPSKLLAEIHGKSVIYWVSKRVKDSRLADYLVATDSEKIADECKANSIPYTMTSNECKNGTERVYEVANKNKNYKYIMNVQGDEPLINISILDKMLKTKGDNDDSFKTAVSLLSQSKNNPSEVKVAMQKDGRIRYASRSLIPYCRDGDFCTYKIHGVYLYTHDVLKHFVKSEMGILENVEKIEQLRCIENDIKIFGVICDGTLKSIDTAEDLEFYRNLEKCEFD